MPITYSVDEERKIINEVWSGEIQASDLEAHWRVYLADPGVMAIRRTLVDLRQASIQFIGVDLSTLVDRVVIPTLGTLRWKTAILADGPVQFGVSRQYEAFAHTYSNGRIFDDRNAALAWLMNGSIDSA